MKHLWPHHVRTRLTLWYVAILAGVLLIYGGSTCAIVLLQLRTQVDHLATEDLETVEGFLSFGSDGKLGLRNDYHYHPYPAETQQRFLEVRAEDGTLLYKDAGLAERVLGGKPEPGEGVDSYSRRSIRLADGMRIRLISRRHMIDGHPAIIRVGFSEEPMWQRFWQLVIGLLVGLPLALGLAGIGGYHLARRALGPVERMARRAREINAEQLDARIDVENPHDELGLLAQALNETLSRLQLSFEQLKRFTSDASHELRTPLTAIRSVGEVGLQQEGDRDHYREVIGSMLEETERLSRLVESLLTISRADSGQIQLQQATIPLVPVVEEASSLLDVLAEEKGQTVSFEGDSSIRVKADTVILRQVVINLLDNAIKYSPRKGHISVRVRRCNSHTACVEVEDCGPGIAPEHRDKVFDRFYRIDEARSREAGGAGLGLALAKWGAEAHGGGLELDSTTAGCIFRLLLPLSADADASEETPGATRPISLDARLTLERRSG
ncbi:MAG: HAMP domain-containing protein [Acidobacteriia bacterium]|nr:HAMP domain-containing protein [Terriglobia bacterium]